MIRHKTERKKFLLVSQRPLTHPAQFSNTQQYERTNRTDCSMPEGGCHSEFEESNLTCSGFQKKFVECFGEEEKTCRYENNATTCYVEVIISLVGALALTEQCFICFDVQLPHLCPTPMRKSFKYVRSPICSTKYKIYTTI